MKILTTKEYIENLKNTISSIDSSAITTTVKILLSARSSNNSIFIAGNGGSASTASHMVTDFMYTSRLTNPTMKVYSLNENISVLTATGNDKGYNLLFSRQLESLATKGDVLILISASGNSMNLLNCLPYCTEKGITTIGLTGFDGGELAKKVDFSIHLQTDIGAYGIVEDCHLVVGHIITEQLKLQALMEDRNA
jgi:D-sedoheptulose 7-phosphate isomerase